jgi:hypothetical protein
LKHFFDHKLKEILRLAGDIYKSPSRNSENYDLLKKMWWEIEEIMKEKVEMREDGKSKN